MKRNTTITYLCILCISLGLFKSPLPAESESVKVTGDFRARLETANQEGRESSDALTLRSRVGLESGDLNGFKFFIEAEDIRAAISSVSVHAGTTSPTLYVDGDYGKETPTTGDGAKGGAVAGVGATGRMIAEDPRALIIAPIILPILKEVLAAPQRGDWLYVADLLEHDLADVIS